jgi:hypothetical protein
MVVCGAARGQVRTFPVRYGQVRTRVEGAAWRTSSDQRLAASICVKYRRLKAIMPRRCSNLLTTPFYLVEYRLVSVLVRPSNALIGNPYPCGCTASIIRAAGGGQAQAALGAPEAVAVSSVVVGTRGTEVPAHETAGGLKPAASADNSAQFGMIGLVKRDRQMDDFIAGRYGSSE